MEMFSILNNTYNSGKIMSAAGDRIMGRMNELGLKHVDLVKGSGASKGTVTNWLTGVNDPTGTRLIELAKTLQVSPEWIISGTEPNVIEGQARRIDDGSTIEMLDPRPVVSWDGSTPLDKDEIAAPFFKDFPVSCGTGTIGEAVLQNEHRRLRLSKSTLRSYGVDPDLVIVVTSHGNSNAPEIKNKATVYVELRRENVSDITDGCFYEICHGGVHFLKKLYSLPGGGVRVVSVNKEEFPEYSLTKDQIESENFTIEGYAFDVQNPLPRR